MRCRLEWLFAILCVGVSRLAAQDAPLAVRLGPNAEAWRTVPYQGAVLDATTIDVDGQKVTAVGANGLVFNSTAPIERDAELLLRLRIVQPPGLGSGLTIFPAQQKPGELASTPLYLQLHAYPAVEQEAVTWTLAAMPGESQGTAGNYISRALPANRLLLPTLTRNRLEQNFAATPSLPQRWLTLRYQFRQQQGRAWLDGRLLRDTSHPQLDTRGYVRINLHQGVQIAEVSLRELPPVDPRFENVDLQHDLNTAQVRGQPVQPGALPAAQPLVVGGIPFVVSAPDQQGRTHIDLGPSWVASGLHEGGTDPAYGDLARWRGALERDPARIRFRVPNGRYTKLHLLAAFTGEPDTTSTVTAQFYRDYAGHPVNFSGTVPPLDQAAADSLPVNLLGKGPVHLHRVTIPLDPNGPVAFSDLRHLEFELTKQVAVYRAYPDPTYYSLHAAGLPSGVQVFGVTLERPVVEIDLQPDQVGHIWTAPAQPSYTVHLKSPGEATQEVSLELATRSHDGQETTTVRRRVEFAGEVSVKLPLSLARYGHHDVELKVAAAGEVQTQRRSLARLHADTRERGNWAEGKGPIFGMWDWNGGHLTVGGLDRLKILAAAGMESSMGNFPQLPAEDQKYLQSIGAKSFFLAYQLSMGEHSLGGKKWDPSKPEEMQAALIQWLKEQPYTKKSPISEPELAVFFAEPLLGPISYMALPEYYGDPPYQMTEDERANFKRILDQFVIASRAIKKEWPHAKCLLPWGIPSFPIAFLRESPEATELMDGPAIDIVMFERMPEMQIHQVTFASTMWQLRQEWQKVGKPWPKLITIEGPGTSPARPGAVTAQQEADHTVRAVLVLSTYDVTRFLGWPGASHCAGYWGEQHYGSGLLEPIPLLNPRPVFSSYATLTRQLNRQNFVKIVPTPSASVFCTQYKHYRTGELLHVLWTLRGARPVSVAVPPGTAVTVNDSMDNATTVSEAGGRVTFDIGTAPVYVHGLTADPQWTLGEPDHRDAQPGPQATVLGNLGDGHWKLSAERDLEYEEVHAEFIKKFPGAFSLHAAQARDGSSPALAVRLEKQEKERRTMPFYTTLVPEKPVSLPGKPSHLGVWAKAASDWGRVVYSLRDAKGERWLSVGKKGEWNVDDTHCWSAFNYDGWRYLTFEMPGNAPYDLYRDAGTSFWGNYDGDGIVDLPLVLEKILVERRTHVIHGTEQISAAADDVLLGELTVEYASAADKTEETIRLSRLVMPVPPSPPNLANPIAQLAAASTTPGPTIAKVQPPEREYDGRRCHVHFAPVEGAKSYDLWVSTYADGRGAVLLGKDWPMPGQLLAGLSPNVNLYLFVVAKDAAGKTSQPGPAFTVNLKDMFPMK